MLYLFYIIYQDSLFDLGFLKVKILHPIIYDFSDKCFGNRVNNVTRFSIKFTGLLCGSKISSSINSKFFQKQGKKCQVSNFKKQVSSSTPPKKREQTQPFSYQYRISSPHVSHFSHSTHQIHIHPNCKTNQPEPFCDKSGTINIDLERYVKFKFWQHSLLKYCTENKKINK